MLVVDASVAIKAYLPEEHSQRAKWVLGIDRPDPLPGLHAPDLIFVECASVLWKYIRRDELTLLDAAGHICDLSAIVISIHATRALASGALALAVKHGISAYDACYVSLAQALGCDLVTANRRLVDRLSEDLPFVRWLGEAEFAVASGTPEEAS